MLTDGSAIMQKIDFRMKPTKTTFLSSRSGHPQKPLTHPSEIPPSNSKVET